MQKFLSNTVDILRIVIGFIFSGMEDNADLLDKVCAYENDAEGQGHMMFPEHLSHEELQNGIRSGRYMKATFQVIILISISAIWLRKIGYLCCYFCNSHSRIA